MPDIRIPPDNTLDHGWGWLNPTEPATVQPLSPGVADGEDVPGSEWQWITADTSQRPMPIELPKRSGYRWLWTGFAVALTTTIVGIGILVTSGDQDTPEALPTETAAPPTSRGTPSGSACTGLSGEIVTDSAGDTHSTVGVIAAWEYAYYVQRSAESALALVAPEAGLVGEALAAGIASIPLGTTHCVAINPIADSTAAEVHLVERHPNGARIDYLQVINVRTDEHRTVITNIQKRG
ncbi:hypothetical protein [Nocardia iowensis]|uniref:DUF8176 domain-containing protein n=1 Tax=Nocardia iowensis TaxID=204891 RepID=A0ABX8S0E8_NOCIO|nr:hypothetical protein [Nocardia iowensis]QXN94577.1 hypothetical protein KV110_16915 [Nocardia iowensis]